MRQLQVKFEKKYYQWITNNAVIGLYELGYLKDILGLPVVCPKSIPTGIIDRFEKCHLSKVR